MASCAARGRAELSKAQAVRRIGILGGTFDPVHIGHLRSALEVAEFMGLDELRLLPNARPPHRDTPQVAAEDRLAMVREAVQGVACLSVDARELARDKPSYTIDTLESIRAELADNDQLFLVLGWDAFCGLPTWHRWDELLQHCHILVLQRPDADVEPLTSCATCWLRARRAILPPCPARREIFRSSGRRRLRCRLHRSDSCWPAANR